MQFIIKTAVAGTVDKVYAGFTRELLVRLTPPFMRLKVIRLDEPWAPGGKVIIQVTVLGLVKQYWENEITESVQEKDHCYFVDEGRILPWPFNGWRHKHLIQKNAEGKTEIVDDITYKSRFKVTEWLFFPVVYAQFRMRKPIYKKVFGAA